MNDVSYPFVLHITVKNSLIILSVIIFAAGFSMESSAKPVTTGTRTYDWFSVFYEHTAAPQISTFVIRPFYLEAENSDNLFQASLMPLFFWRYKNRSNDITKGFFGLYESVDYRHPGKRRDYDSGLFPLYLYGKGYDDKESYLFIYPFGGNIRGKLAYDRISPYVFPGVALFFIFPPTGLFTWQTLFLGLAALIPAYTEFEQRDYSGKAILWPLIAWGKGEKREDFRVLPFYAHNSKVGWYDNYQYLLLINYREMYLTDDVKYTFFIFPLFGKKWSGSGRMKSYTLLWPFFSWGYDLDRKESEYNLPWPLVQIGDSENPKMRKRIFFPFWGEYETSTYSSRFITPLYFNVKKNDESLKSDYHITAVIFWYFKREYSYTHQYYGRSWRYFKLWPLVQSEWNDQGMFSINILSLLPFRDTDGYEKLYQPFWTLFEYRRKADGEKHLGLILRTYYQVWNDDFFKMKIPVLISYESRNEGLKEFTVLLGAFGYEKDADGTYIKMAWIPIRIGEGDSSFAVDCNIPDSGSLIAENSSSDRGFNLSHGNFVNRDLEDKFMVRTVF